ncbi:hypothetical protein [Streptomyces phaeochromogenes]|uniref:hypothetical protein n=1 Tax=Streptomyces phaeochromogenes TaxID=1923 RepID=UPI0036C275CA
MPRNRTPRFVLALAALLVALQFLSAMVPGASGRANHSPAQATPLVSSTSVNVADRAEESATCGEAGHIADPASWLAGRDRHRPTPNSDTRAPVCGVRAYAFTALPPGDQAASQLALGVSAAPALASLQVCRC